MLTVNSTNISVRYLAIALVAMAPAFSTGCATTSMVGTPNGSMPSPACGTEGCLPAQPQMLPQMPAGPACTASGCGTTVPSQPVGGYTINAGCADGTCAPQPMAGSVCATGAPGCTDGAACGIQPCAGSSCTGCGGCNVPRELNKTALPEYRIEPPDVLLIEAVHNLRPVTAPVMAGEPLLIQVNNTLPALETEDPVAQQFKTIDGPYIIGTDGYVNLGPEYGKVLCAGEDLPEIQRRVETHLNRILKRPQVMVTLPDPTAKQVVAGPHLVRPDGTVGLGIYGGVFVAGKSLREAKACIEQHLSQHMHQPEVSVDVLNYRSKVYYVIADGGGAGEQVHRLPCTGNETVLDAISQIRGLPTVANKGRIWVARPTDKSCGLDQVLHVDWDAIAQGGQTCTNYQLLPGDRLYVKADGLIAFDTKMAKFTAPFERLLGFTVLGNGAVRGLQQGSGSFNNGGF